MTDSDRWCFCWFAEAETGTARAALRNNTRWARGSTIPVSFLDGSEALQERVMRAASLWTGPGLANVKFAWETKTTATPVRVSFQYRGSWSMVGNTCREITDRQRPTMNFGWLRDTSTDEEVEGVVLHEFGHALGLIHEHQSPAHGIQWDVERVVRDLSGPPNSWDRRKIEVNMFEPAAAGEHNHTDFDPDSIMMYAFPPEWTKNKVSMKKNTKLSEMDKRFIAQEYPR